MCQGSIYKMKNKKSGCRLHRNKKGASKKVGKKAVVT